MSFLETPSFLIALPNLTDPNFFRSIVLLLESDDNGSLGFILNKPAPYKVKDVLVESDLDVPPSLAAWYGGPVDTERGLVLHNQPSAEEVSQFGQKICLSSSEEAVEGLLDFARTPESLKTQYDSKFPYRFVVGYAGWGKGQLTEELLAGAWIHLPFSKELAFSTPADEMWECSLKHLGVDPSEIVPSANPYLN